MSHIDPSMTLKSADIETPLGPMMAIANDNALYLLEFVGQRGVEREVERLQKRLISPIIPGETPILSLITQELKLYFEGILTEFKTPLYLLGSPFQQRVWGALKKIPFGETQSYLDTAKAIGKPSACRAVANANGANQIAIVIPCHRVINTNGALGGYGGGVSRKQWLLDHEKQKK